MPYQVTAYQSCEYIPDSHETADKNNIGASDTLTFPDDFKFVCSAQQPVDPAKICLEFWREQQEEQRENT